MSVAIYAAELLDDTLHARRQRARQLALAVGVSLLAHLLAVAVFPGLRKGDVETQRPLEVRIVPPVPEPPKPEPPPRVKPPPPPPITRAPLPKPQPRPAPVQPAAAPPSKPVLALPETAGPAVPAFTVPKPAAEAPAPTAEARITAAPAAAPAPPAKEVPITAAVFDAAYLGNTAPRYPPMARRSGIEGTAYVRVLVSRDGRALQVALDRTSGSSVLDNAAIEQAKTWKFAPARRGPEPIEQWVKMPFVYKLEGSS